MNVEDAGGFSCESVKRFRSNSPVLSDGARNGDSDLQTNEVISSVAQLSVSDSCETISCSDTENMLQRVKDQHKISMKNKFERLYKGVNLQEDETHLNKIGTQLFITKEKNGEPWIESDNSPHIPVNCNHIFTVLHEDFRDQKNQIKSVLTKGIAGIGKTVSVQKFILDWAEGEDNHDVDFVFVLPFRELNLIKQTQNSLHELLLDFHPELQDLDSKYYEKCKVLFIFDGFDQSRMKLEFSEELKVSNVNTSSSVSLLLLSLIRGDLLPSALIWITTRLAAADQIPPEYISRETEILGFSEAQQEEYFKKRISDEDVASRIISHIRRSRSLQSLCHIPVFCWISATVLQNILKQDNTVEIPQTLTEMYIHFLVMQIHTRKLKFEENDPEKILQSSREVIVKLSELAYNQLIKGNVMFYEEDMRESGIDVTDASVHSGIFTEIIKEESVVLQKRVFCFVHLSFQEFLAAFHKLYHVVWNNKHAVLLPFLPFPNYSDTNLLTLDVVLDTAVDDSLRSENGRLDLFLRFLLGVSLESNQRLLQDLLTHTVKSSETITNITQKIKDKLKAVRHLSADTLINLYLCLLEMKDQIQYRDVLRVFQWLFGSILSVSHCSVIAYMLQISEEVVEEITLTDFITTPEGKNRLIPAVINCRKAIFCGYRNDLSDAMLESFSSCLQSSNSALRELDLSMHKLQDSEVKILSDGLKSPNCRLEKLKLSDCALTDQHCESLSSCLQSSNSSLRDLDLSENELHDSGVKILSDGLRSPNCRLEKLRLSNCGLTDRHCESLSSCLQSSNSSMRDLDLSENGLHDSGVKILSDGLKSSNCRLEKLRLKRCGLTDGCCERLSSCLQSSNSSLRELDLNWNDIHDSGVKILSDGLKSSNCRLEILKLSSCRLTDGCCEILSSCLQCSNSALRELDLNRNDIHDSGVKILSDGLLSPDVQLEKLRLGCCKFTEEGRDHLSSTLQSSPSRLREIVLAGESLVKRISDPNKCDQHHETNQLTSPDGFLSCVVM